MFLHEGHDERAQVLIVILIVIDQSDHVLRVGVESADVVPAAPGAHLS
jgi:hypothetical protein